MSNRWATVAIGSAVALSVVGAIIAFQPDPGWDDPEYYTYELTRIGPPPDHSEYLWLLTVESSRVVSAVLQVAPSDFDPIGYALPAVGALVDYANTDKNLEVTYEDGYPTAFCYRHPGNPEWDLCERVSAITPLSPEAARDTWSWREPASYSVTVRTESVTWGLWTEWRLVVENGTVTDATWLAESERTSRADPPTEGVRALVFHDGLVDPYWTAYWRDGDPNPAAVCHDDPNMFDEETCHYFSDYEIKP